MPTIYFEIIGWVGTIAIMVAYWLVSIGKISPVSKTYQLLNLFGAGFVIINVVFHGALPSVALNTIWFFIALFGLFQKSKK
ncbi:hypothetical protein A3K29_01980 [Candidatus Collierbacteria bacterium RIFOXYB2_FULL_46_14]|uniref:CBU-0592-like domain-containing protein n=1 Tax=Candidatus Collierbacteria bacterium GW2011_GWA2_46_26 TaxID=1618381 RepID=A0A0G1RSH7_9BACT|nr:MAG: hypothetical protein UW29_C0011G0035 [Candidatus Collierbacteria bacterium GW2011_GWC2_44_13]KKU32918.1 MAG: hypothetical protein UX47_C0007G0162 [Candidatus Collierbacteria bacterium GW2011_GWA2_46_26]OGD72895.1 MAG: hypothetical protein A3K29_01980 [Candidatus Collierbacteria bacterium RIFOXYB2_FULL_46_14]OGD75937.1 MAG: hypothetical protein A3K43_01980 [Candidatus Collierbacteria bacterium RIFOXYA2_FULL_46_20]OGD77273.1 MAG: hypothetical protein A3K39_01980 [Candidatus Collierbacteri